MVTISYSNRKSSDNRAGHRREGVALKSPVGEAVSGLDPDSLKGFVGL